MKFKPCFRFWKKVKNFIFLPIILNLFACEPKRNEVPETDVEGFITKHNLWPNSTASVCFMETKEASASYKKLVKETVIRGINDKTEFKFTGFHNCSEKRAQIYVEVYQNGIANSLAGSQTNPLVRILYKGYYGKVTLYLGERGIIYPEYLAHNVILHEFGHALGLYHEHMREDSTCKAKAGGLSHSKLQKIAVKYGKYDENSIMNYCHPNYFKSKFYLSQEDIKTINFSYGSKH
jgi:hypothetical protein